VIDGVTLTTVRTQEQATDDLIADTVGAVALAPDYLGERTRAVTSRNLHIAHTVDALNDRIPKPKFVSARQAPDIAFKKPELHLLDCPSR